MDLEWLKLRPFNGDQKSVFEELVCQLADMESAGCRKEFRRLGTPDGGVEAYYVLLNGDEHGWQAKFFQNIGSTQWSEIKESIETALRTHPNLVLLKR